MNIKVRIRRGVRMRPTVAYHFLASRVLPTEKWFTSKWEMAGEHFQRR